MRTLCWLLAPALALGLGALAPAADAPKADAAHIAKLVKQLGDDDFETREKATRELEKVGTPALEALREAAKSGDSEVKTRAAGVVEKIEKQIEAEKEKAAAAKLLAPTKVKLSFKDTPLAEAVAEFNKKSGYTITVHDPDKKLKDRKVTLDTSEVTFWEAFDKFCEKAGLVEATWQDVMRPIPVRPGGIRPVPPPAVTPPAPPKQAPAPKKDDADKAPAPAAAQAVARQAPPVPPTGGGVAGGAIAAPALRVMPGIALAAPGTITVVDGKSKSVPTCYAGAVRVRALTEAPNLGLPFAVPPGGAPAAKEDNYTVWLEVRAEPKLQLQMIQSIKLDKATDNKDQKLEALTPPAPAVPGGGFGGGAVPPGVPVARPPIVIGGFGGMMGGVAGFGGTQNYPVQLKKGEKESKALKEFAGTIKAGVWVMEPVITADKITKAGGETFKGKDGGQIKVIEVKEEDGKITVKFELEQPLPPGVIGVPGGGIRGIPVPLRPAPAPLPPAAGKGGGAGLAVKAGGVAVAQVVQIQIGGPAAPPGVAVRPFIPSAPGVTLVDDKGKTIAQTGGAPAKFQFNPGGPAKVEYTQEYKLEKDQKPTKLVYSAGKTVAVDIPFSFKDVPLK